MATEIFNKAVERITARYEKQDNCLYDFLSSSPVPRGLTLEQAFNLYVTLMNNVEGDGFIRYNQDERWQEDLVTGDRTSTRESIADLVTGYQNTHPELHKGIRLGVTVSSSTYEEVFTADDYDGCTYVVKDGASVDIDSITDKEAEMVLSLLKVILG